MIAVFGNVMSTDTNASGKSIASIFKIVFIDTPETPRGQDPLQRWYGTCTSVYTALHPRRLDSTPPPY
jgi:hypothetical protein